MSTFTDIGLSLPLSHSSVFVPVVVAQIDAGEVCTYGLELLQGRVSGLRSHLAVPLPKADQIDE